MTLSDLEDTSDDDGSQFDSDEVNKYLLLRVPKTPAGTEFDLLKWWAAHELELPRSNKIFVDLRKQIYLLVSPRYKNDDLHM